MVSIYVQIPAYRDSELEPTLLNILAKSSRRNRIRIGVIWQRSEDETLSPVITSNPDIEITEVPFEKSRGCNWARSLLQEKWQGEEYTLLLDSHHRLVKDWDVKMIEMYRSLEKDGVQKPLITAYLPSYNPRDKSAGWRKRPLKIYPLRRDGGMLTHLTSFPIPMWNWLKKPIIAEFISLHFIFTAGVFNREVPFDSSIYFFGDEVYTSLAAFTSGYLFFHPHYVIGWHLYDRETRIPHWSDHDDWYKTNDLSYQKLRDIFSGKDTGRLGSARTIQDYETFIGNRLLIQ